MLSPCTVNCQTGRHYGHTLVVLSFTKYAHNGRTCLRLVEVDGDREAQACAACTVNLCSASVGENEVAIQTWHENVGMLEWLIDEGIVSELLWD